MHAGHVISRPAGTGVAHVFGAGDDGLELLALQPSTSPTDMCFYPRSGKISIRGLEDRLPHPARGLLGRRGVSPAPRGAVRSRAARRDGQGRRRQDDGRRRARRRGRAARPAGDRRRGRRARRRDARARRRGRAARRRGRAGLRRAPHLDRSRGRDARVPRRPAALAHAGRAAHRQPHVLAADRRHARAARAADDRQGLGARPGGPPDAGRPALRSRHPRCSRHRPRRRRALGPAHVRRHRA